MVVRTGWKDAKRAPTRESVTDEGEVKAKTQYGVAVTHTRFIVPCCEVQR
jgi:hypothetical protein